MEMKLTENIDIKDERCENCALALGPASMPHLICGGKDSNFYRGPVLRDGYCRAFWPKDGADKRTASTTKEP